jgi:PAS domain S-box-containing protein
MAELKHRKNQARLLIASLAAGSLASAGAVWWYYTRQLAAMEAAVVQELTTTSTNQTSQIASWRKERLGDGRTLMAAPILHLAVNILSKHSLHTDTEDLLDVLARMQSAFLYSGAILCDLDGNVRLASDGASGDTGRLRDLARAAVAAKDAQLADLSLDPHTGRPVMALTIPVQELGAIILDIDPARFLFPYLRAWPGSSQTAETLMLRRDGTGVMYLSELRYHPGAPLHFYRSLTGSKIPTDDAAFDSGPLFRGPDYRGVTVLAIIRRVPNSPWFLSTKMDAAEADAPERRLGWEMFLVTTLIALVDVIAAALVWRGQRARIHEERETWFRSIANDTPAYLFMVSPHLENTFINTPFARFLGTDQNRLSQTWSDYIHPGDVATARNNLQEHLKTRTEYTYDLRMRRHDGEYRWMVSRAVPRFSAEGEFLGFAGSVMDVTGRRLAEQKLREANASIATELAESTRKEQEIADLSARLIDAQEEERKRLARELHDDLSQRIAAVSIATGNLKRQIPAEFAGPRGDSDRIHQKLVEMAESVRRMSHELHPAILEYSGLAAALAAYCEEFGELSGIQIAVQIEGSFENVAPAPALSLFRVAQEALHNVAKHAKVSAASVELKRGGGILQLTISDNGAGMAPGRAEAKAGLGLLNIKERARLVKGKVEIRSAPGEGTTVTVQVPDTGHGD